MSVGTLVLWAVAGLLLYIYIGYPGVIALVARLWARPVHRGRPRLPLTLLIVAHNEAGRIGARLENCLALRYDGPPPEILLGVDGASDGTAEAAAGYAGRVRLVRWRVRRGKAAVLNELIPRAHGEIVVLADARQIFHRDALRALVAPFADPRVGAVSGELVLRNHGGCAVGEGVGAYWRYEKWIRRNEARIDSTVGVTGAIYAIRRRLFSPIPEDTILDDVLIPMKIARQGYRVVFEPHAVAYDRAARSASEEITRKVRTIAGNVQLFAREPWLLHPLRNRLWIQTVSHKGLRLASPLLLGIAFTANLFLLDRPLYRLTFAAQVIFYLAALAGASTRNARRRLPLLSVPYAFCLLNWATVVAWLRFLTGTQRVTWERAS